MKCVFLFVSLFFAQTLWAADKPNILFILADDMGYMDLGCTGSDLYRTPNIDRLASQGTRFTQAYTAAHVCSPTRASIMTGKYPARLHLTDFLKGHNKPFAKLKIPEWTTGLPESETTLAELLKPQGYAAAWLGKWHLGGGAEDHGFDAGHQDWKQNTKQDAKDPKGVFTLNAEAFDFIAKNREKPFFVALSHYSVHGPIRYEDGLMHAYEKIVEAKKPRQANAGYAAMVEALDASVGQILDYLDRENLAANTLVIFFSDNGGVSGFTDNHPLRGSKGTLYQGGVRVPLIARWPGHVPVGKTSDIRVCSIDFFPTFAALAGAPAPQNIDGIDLSSVLTGAAALPRDALYWHYPHYHVEKPSGAILQGDWKLIEWFETGKTELFNLASDLGETKDASAENPGKTADLLAGLKAWREKVGAQMPTPNPAHDPARADQGEAKAKKPNKKKIPKEKTA
jgi:arylsulfatase A-like enzyme